MQAEDLEHLHPNDVRLFLFVEEAAFQLAEKVRVPLRRVIPTDRRDTKKVWGRYWFHQHIMALTFREWDRKKGWERNRAHLHQILDTIAHELAHGAAGYKADHGKLFFRAYGRILDAMSRMNLDLTIQRSGAKLRP